MWTERSEVKDHRPHVPMPQREIMTVQEAALFADVSDQTIYRWAKRYKIGRQYRDSWNEFTWQISRVGLLMVMDRRRLDFDSLEAFMTGDRLHPVVAEYIEKSEMVRVAQLAA